MKSKILFFDIDGTLLNSDGIIPESAINALIKARKNGHQIVICSGRARFQVSDWIMEYADGLVGCAGALVEKNKEIVHEEFMPDTTIRRIQEVFDEAGGELAYMCEKTLRFKQSCKDLIYERYGRLGLDEARLKIVVGDAIITNHPEEYKDYKKVIYHQSNWSVAKVAKALEDVCDVTPSSFEKGVDDSGEISIKGINKAFGMQKYIEIQGYGREDTIAFGDGPNDFDMIEYAGTGVVMGNGIEELKAIADFVTKDINEDGIEYAMKYLGLI